MIPQAGSAYAYSYATLGELIAWIIGWDLILEYAVGNIAVAIAWSGYFNSLLSGFGVSLPDYLTHGYRTALLSSESRGPRAAADRAADRRDSDPAQHSRGADRARHHLAALPRRAREHARQQHHGRGEAGRAGRVRRARRHAHRHGELHAVRAERLARHPPGGRDRLLRLHRLRRDLDRGGRDEEPAAQHADRHSRRPGDLHR